MSDLNHLKLISSLRFNVSVFVTSVWLLSMLGIKAIMTYVDPVDPFVQLKLDAKKHAHNRHGLP